MSYTTYLTLIRCALSERCVPELKKLWYMVQLDTGLNVFEREFARLECERGL